MNRQLNMPDAGAPPGRPSRTAAIGIAGKALVEWRGTDTIDSAFAAEWAALAAGCDQLNVFAEPWFAIAGLRHCCGGDAAEVAMVRAADGMPLGVALITDSGKRIGRAPLVCGGNWSHPNSFLAATVASRGKERMFWAALVPALATRTTAARALLIEGLVEGSALYGSLTEAMTDIGLPVTVETRSIRAMLATDEEADAYWDSSVRAKKRKELRRQWARLGEMGALSVDHGNAEDSADNWIDEFLALEASGWKGANGSALASNPDTLAFFREAMAAGWAREQVLLTALRLDGRAVAMLITLVSGAKPGGAGFSFKTAFDENYARFSPGVLLQRESLGLLTSRKLAFIDSCAAQDHPMIDSLWRERRTILSVSLPLPGTANRLAWQATQAAMAVWRGAKRLRQPSPPMARKGEEE